MPMATKRLKTMGVLLALVSFCGCFSCSEQPAQTNKIYPEKQMKTDGQLYMGSGILFPSELWTTPEAERYVALDNGFAQGYFIKSMQDTDVFCFVGIPQDATEQNKVPGIVLVHGGGGTAFFEWVNYWVGKGYAAIAMDTDGTMPTEASLMNTSVRVNNPRNAGPHNLSFGDKNKDITEQWVYHALSAIIAANSFLRSFEGVDAARIGITGISWGSFLTCQSIAYDDRYAFAIPVYGSFEQRFGHGTTWSSMMEDGKIAALWDDGSILGKNNTPVFYINSSNDPHFSPVSTSLSHSMTKYSSMLLKYGLLHGHDVGGLNIEETVIFANNICFGEAPLLQITKQPSKGNAVMGIKAISVEIEQVVGYYTFDEVVTPDTVWIFTFGDAENGVCSVDIPTSATYFFMNAMDSRGAEISSEVVSCAG